MAGPQIINRQGNDPGGNQTALDPNLEMTLFQCMDRPLNEFFATRHLCSVDWDDS